MRAAANRKKENPLIVVAVVALMSFLGVLIETSMNVTFPTLERNFHVSLATVQWVTSGYLLAAALVMLTSAYMKRRFTNQTLFTWAAALFIGGDLLCGTALAFPQLLVGRLIQAGCVGLCTPLMVNIVLDVVPRAKLGTYLGLANMIVLVAPALGPTFGGAIAAFSSWRMIFWGTLPVAIVLLLIGRWRIRQYSPTQAYAFDWARFGILAVALSSLIIGLNAISTHTWGLVGGGFGLAAAGLIGFYALSRHATRHLFSLAVFHDPAFLFSFLPYILLQFGNVGINFLLPNYVQAVFGASAFAGGLILLPGSVLNGFGQPLYGWMLDHLGGRVPLYLGAALFTVALAWLGLAGPHLGVGGVTWVYLLFAIGRSMAFANSVAYGLKKIAKPLQNDANALYNTGQQVAGALGTTVLALLMNSIHRPAETPAQNTAAGSALAFWLLVGFGLIVLALFYRLLHVAASNKAVH